MSLLFRHLADSFRKPDHWLYAAWLDVITRYRKTVLGLFWIFFPTIVYIWGLGGFLGAIQGTDMHPYLAHIGFGFVIFRLISTVVMEAGSSFVSYQSYIYEGNLRLTDFTLRPLFRALVHFLFAVPLLAIVLTGEGGVTFTGFAISLGGTLVVLVNLFFYGVLIGLVGARYPDINDFLGSVMLAVFLVTPIIWLAEAAPSGTLQGDLMRANPFHHLLAIMREPLLGKPLEDMTYYYLAGMTTIGIVLAATFYGRFAKRVPTWL
jgi:ABC-type polysaccharide/polyol phosphate export permease